MIWRKDRADMIEPDFAALLEQHRRTCDCPVCRPGWAGRLIDAALVIAFAAVTFALGAVWADMFLR